MVIAILPALIPDIRKVYNSYFAAFKGEQMGQMMLKIIFPNDDTDSDEFRDAHAKGTLSYWHTCDHQYTYKAVDMTTGEIVGMALCDILIKWRTEEERKNHGVPWLTGEAKERAERVLNPLHDIREELFGGSPHIYAHVIGVEPSHQGKHAGAALAKFGIEVCDKTGLPIYFESSPSVVGLYEKVGYQRLKETVVHSAELMGTEEEVVVPLMVRMPSSTKMDFYEWKAKGYPSLGGARESRV